MTFLYTVMNYQKENLKKQSHLLLQQQRKNKACRNKFNQEGKRQYLENYKTLKKEIEEDTK